MYNIFFDNPIGKNLPLQIAQKRKNITMTLILTTGAE